MVSKTKRRVLAALLMFFSGVAATPTPDPSYVGLQLLGLIGVHRDVTGNQYGVGVGPLLQIHAGAKRMALHLEGVPVVSVPGVRPTEAYGQATPKVGIFQGQAEFALDPGASLWGGIGETVYNQRTPLPAKAQTVSSRLAGVRYALRFRHLLGHGHFVEALVGVTPYLSGADVYVYLSGAPNLVKPERASEVDASLTYGVTHHRSQWLFGLRTLNFTASYPVTGEAADRLVGGGPIIEYRYLLH
jgi:hypothetical protein